MSDAVRALLEEAGCPAEINEVIVRLIEGWEWAQVYTLESEP